MVLKARAMETWSLPFGYRYNKFAEIPHILFPKYYLTNNTTQNILNL